MRRGLFAWSETCPNCGPSSTLLSGKSNCGRLKRLKTSTRNWRPSFPSGPNVVVLNNAKSQLLIPSARTLGRFLPTLPKVNAGGSTKQAVLNHSFNRLSADPPSAAPCGHAVASKLGLSVPAKAWARSSPTSTWIGKPLPGYSMNTLEISFPLAKWEVEHVAQDQALRYVEG